MNIFFRVLAGVCLASFLTGCSTVNITYHLTGDNNTVEAQGQVTSPKEISTAGSAYGAAKTGGGQ